MTDPKRPMKPHSKSADTAKLQYPVLCSTKIDGIRGVVQDGVLLSNSLKPIQNPYTQSLFSHLEGMDGELVVGEPNAPDLMQKCGALMRKTGEPDVRFFVFDDRSEPGEDYFLRYNRLHDRCEALNDPRVVCVRQEHIESEAELLRYEAGVLDQGYEGVIVRGIRGPYKYGRSTLKEGYLLRIKRFSDSEAVIIDFVEGMHNTNEAERNELGRTKRSSAKGGLVPNGTLGAFVALTPEGQQFRISPGKLSHEDKQEVWNNRLLYRGRFVKYKHFATTGVKDKPRHATWLAWRDPNDMEPSVVEALSEAYKWVNK